MTKTIEFVVLGCRAGAPGEGVAASGYLVRNKGKTILLDCGPGVTLELTRQGFADELSAAVITHAHADHCADLVALAYHRLFPHALPPLDLWGSAPVRDVLQGLDTLFGIPSLPALATPLRRAFAFHALATDGQCEIAGLDAEFMSTLHPTPTLAVRFPELGLVYTADGALTDDLATFARSATLLVAECTYVSANSHNLSNHGHMTAEHAAQLAARANARALLLTHFASYADAQLSARLAAAHFHGQIYVARPGMRVQL
jgi:ribonuclease BN (tRNA processing enzyme)